MKRILLLFPLLSLILSAHAQDCAPDACVGNNVPLALTCQDACIICDLDGYSGTNSVGVNTIAPAQFCAQVNHNILWVGFVAGTPNLTIEMTISACQNDDGLQVGIYGTTDCSNFTAATNCIPAAPEGVHTLTSIGNLIPGQTYYVVIDGNNADVCDFSFNVISGSTAVQPIIGPPPPIQVPSSICPGGTLGFGLPGGIIPNAGFYNWTINGTPVTCEASGTYQVPTATPDGSTLQICYQADNPCHPALPQVCTTVTVQELPVQEEQANICEGESYNFYGQNITPPGPGVYDYTTDLTLPSGCIQPVELELEVTAEGEFAFADEICEEDLPYVLAGMPLAGPPGDNTFQVTVVNPATGCDSTITLDLVIHPSYAPPYRPPVFVSEQICEGESVMVGGQSYGSNLTANPQPYGFDIMLNSSAGCDSSVFLQLQVFPVPTPVTIDTIICDGDYVEIGGLFFYDQPGIYPNTIPSIGGCDSLVTLVLNVYTDPNPSLDTTICNGSSVTIGAQTFDQSGNYQVPLQSFLGCDSTINLTLTVLDPIETMLFESICEGESFTIGNSTYTTAGDYTEVLTADDGCDSTVYLALTVFPEPVTDLTETVCFGESFTVGNSTYSASGSYSDILMSADGCDSTVNLTLTVLPQIEDFLTGEVCEGETFEVGMSIYDATGAYVDTLTAANGCDSLVFLDLTVLEIPETFLDIAICDGESYQVGSSSYNATGQYTDILTAASGCDSIVYLDLQVISAFMTTLNREICTGQTFTVGTSTYADPGTYVDTLVASIGCDSIVTLNLSVSEVLTDSLIVSICEGESFTIGTTAYSSTGFYSEAFTTAEGCDSVAYLDLTVLPVPVTNLTPAICEGETFTVGVSDYTNPGSYVDTLTAANGCDSIVFTDLTVLPVPVTNLTPAICEGETFTVGPSGYANPGSYIDTLTAANGCDSIIFTDLTVLPVPVTNLTPAICEGETFTVGASGYTSPGSYVDTLAAANGCDSIVFTELIVLPVPTTSIDTLICAGESLTVGGSTYSSSGSFTDILTAANGCDSIVSTNLVVFQPPVTNLEISICEGGSFTVGSSSYNSDGVYTDTLTASVGCDSIVILDLTVTDFYQTPVNVTLCEGESYTLAGVTYDMTGVYSETFLAVDGCDSIVTLNLTVLPVPTTDLDISICDNEDYQVGGSVYNTTGVFVDTLSAANGCDSIVTLNLTVLPTFFTDLSPEICDGETFQVGTSTYTMAGQYLDTLTAANGCDSVVATNLTVFPIPATQLTETICFGDTYTVGTTTFTATGVYVETLTSFTGCDSIVTLDLTVRDLIETDLAETICFGDTYTVGTSTYDSSGFYVDTLTAANGCDSIVRLDLTERDLIETNLVVTLCEGETTSVGTSTYNTTGIYQDVLTSVETGCDSIVNLDLTVNPVFETFLTEAICDGESFQVGTSTYTTAGAYTDLLTAANGCDSTVYLDLTVHPIPETLLTESICEGESFTVGTATYNTTGVFVNTLTAFTGCDSIVTLDLTVIETAETFLTEAICDGETFSVGSSVYTESGQYQDVLTSTSTGCDSIVYLDLTVHPVYETVLTEEICNDDSFPVGNESFSSTGTFEVLLASAEGCDSLVILNLTVFPCQLNLATSEIDATCNGSADGSIDLTLFVGTPPYSFEWTGLSNSLSGSGNLAGNNQTATIPDLPAGLYQITVTDSNGIAATVTATVNQPAPITVTLQATAYAGGFNTSCPGENDGRVTATAGGGTGPYTFTWNTGALANPLDDLTAGDYQVTVTDQNGCEATAEISLTQPTDISAVISTQDPPCFGDRRGIIRVDTVSGGVPPYLYALNNGTFSSSTAFTNLEIGIYDVQIQDANGCVWVAEATIDQPQELVVNLGADIFISQGETVSLFADVNLPVDTFLWTTRDSLSCYDCQRTITRPLNTATYAVTVIDANGCFASDEVTVFVEKPYEVYIPNAFSPNGDNANDMLLIFAGADVVKVQSFQVFNRWGETMFELYNFQPNDPANGWDGTHRGQTMNPGVYVYSAAVEFIDGEVKLFYGDVLLTR